ncbi:MAG TPA: hypothetical protein VFZ65_06470, partial [Planctomycetota bacterium]|nr:hypothetical protein [Planctomycetota bacterium]
RALYSIDIVTAQKVQFGTISANAGTPGELVHDAATGVTFLTSTNTASLYTIDLGTGAATLVGPFGDPAIIMHGLELDSSTGQLYGSSQHNGGFYAIDRATGAATLLGVSGLINATNLGYDRRTDTMFATNAQGDELFTVDRATGAMTLVGPLVNSTHPQALAYDSDTGVLYEADNVSDQLFAIDTATGVAHVVGSTGAANLLGLAYVPGGTGGIERLAHQCGSVSIVAAGATLLGGSVTTWVGATTGVPFVGYGLSPTAIPFCGCTVGHEWAVAVAGDSSTLSIPVDVTLHGLQVGIQGLDLFGVGGCSDPAIVLSDTLVLTIG